MDGIVIPFPAHNRRKTLFFRTEYADSRGLLPRSPGGRGGVPAAGTPLSGPDPSRG